MVRATRRWSASVTGKEVPGGVTVAVATSPLSPWGKKPVGAVLKSQTVSTRASAVTASIAGQWRSAQSRLRV